MPRTFYTLHTEIMHEFSEQTRGSGKDHERIANAADI